MSEFMKSDKNLDKDVNAAQSPDEIRELLYRAVERSQIGYTRDPVSGRFVSTGDSAQRQTTDAAAEPHTYTRSAVIGGETFDFTANDPETLEIQINSAREVYRQLENSQDSAAEIETARQQRIVDDTTNSLRLQRGEIDIKTYMALQGVDLDQLREQTQKVQVEAYEKNWSDAVTQFLAVDGPGADYPGGKNQKLMEMALVTLGLQDQPSVESLAEAWNYLKQRGTLFPHEAEVTQAEILRATEKMAPAEILELWKQSQPGASYGDGTQANENFIAAYRRK